jgi:DNA-binding NtrC family response regulator
VLAAVGTSMGGAPHAVMTAPSTPAGPVALVGSTPSGFGAPGVPAVPTALAPAEESLPDGPVSLAEVARAAAMKAERTAIERTLRQVHWNRRKAAQLLGVSYKTLLNKIKECGISRR